MSSRLSAVPRFASGFTAIALTAITLPAFAGKPAPPPPTPPPPPPGITTRVSVAADGTQANSSSYNSIMTPDARYAVFVSTATNLVPGDTNGMADVFVRDRTSGAIERVNVASDGSQANNSSYGITVSADGRYVAFESYATNLVSGTQATTYPHIYLHDRLTHVTERISVASDGTPADRNSYSPAVSADGRYVAFESYASNLVAGDTNSQTDVFVRDRATGTTERVSVAAGGTQGNGRSAQVRISADGHYVLFLSDATNLVAGDTNAATDLFLYDRVTHAPERVSLGAGGVQANGHNYASGMSPDARWVVFSSDATNLVSGDTNGFVDVFLRDRATGLVERMSVSGTGAQGNWDSYAGSVSADGNVVTFISYASNLVAGDGNPYGDVFVRIRSNATTERVNLSSAGAEANDETGFSFVAVSDDGRFVAFDSYASNLVAGDTNGVDDVFLRERLNSP
jgi:Tol biopolymer transport system component